MSPVPHRWRIDPGPAGRGEVELFAPDGEHAVAVRRLCAAPAARHLPDEVVLHLHAYELLERMRAVADGGRTWLRFPFWPESLFAAAGVRAHAADELLACMPPPAAVHCALPEDAALARAARAWLGELRFDPRLYRWSLRACAHRRGFLLDDVPDDLLDGPPMPAAAAAPAPDARVVAGGVLVRDGSVLLERRPDDAAVYAGVWDTPGGHVEAGETAAGALVRELREELGIDITSPQPLCELHDQDPTSGRRYRHVVFAVAQWRGAVVPRLGQRLCWLPAADVLCLHRLNPLVRPALARLLDDGRLLP